ncbi:transcriptional regulator [Mycobacteroides abscessus subsp. abscessus]|nr:transcriptional regulator [Mycobacteroides abscessus subsp. abscessus]
MGQVAASLHIGERTLHRRLAREGTSYRALLDEVRETLARELLRNGLSVREVSDRLGYSEPAAFTHAYTRWRGMPPSAR